VPTGKLAEIASPELNPKCTRSGRTVLNFSRALLAVPALNTTSRKNQAYLRDCLPDAISRTELPSPTSRSAI